MIKLNIEFNGDRPLFTAFHTVQQGAVFAYQGNYYIRIESVTATNCVRLTDGAPKYLDNHEQVLIVPAKLVIN